LGFGGRKGRGTSASIFFLPPKKKEKRKKKGHGTHLKLETGTGKLRPVVALLLGENYRKKGQEKKRKRSCTPSFFSFPVVPRGKRGGTTPTPPLPPLHNTGKGEKVLPSVLFSYGAGWGRKKRGGGVFKVPNTSFRPGIRGEGGEKKKEKERERDFKYLRSYAFAGGEERGEKGKGGPAFVRVKERMALPPFTGRGGLFPLCFREGKKRGEGKWISLLSTTQKGGKEGKRGGGGDKPENHYNTIPCGRGGKNLEHASFEAVRPPGKRTGGEKKKETTSDRS